MKKLIVAFIVFGMLLNGWSLSVWAQKAAIYSYTVEIELTSDQGDMAVKEYLKNYGTKGKKQGIEVIYKVVTPFLAEQLNKSGFNMLPVDTLNTIKENDYGKPSATLAKVVKSGIADEYIKVYLKDITMPNVEGLTQQDRNSQQRKSVKMRCRIQVYNSKKELTKEGEGVFQSGEKIENPSILGVDLRTHEGSDYLQELKIYETCTKMAILRTLEQMGK